MTGHPDVFLSVIIPAFDEAGRIADTVRRVTSYLDAQPWTWQILVVLDGGRTGSAEAIRSAAAGRSNVRTLDNETNRGKGFSVRRGMLAATGRFRVFVDADLSLPIEGTAALVAELERGAGAAIGSRAVPGSAEHGERARLRHVMGRLFNGFVRALAVRGVRDTQCGFKGFRGEAADAIFRLSRIDRFGFDVEVLRLAQRLGYRIAEVPVTCTYHGVSSVRLRDVAAMIVDVLKVRWWEATGGYVGVGHRGFTQ